MADLKIWCLVNGTKSKKAFSVQVCSDDTVDDLKDAIKAKKPNYFEKIDADDLALWCASISWDSPDPIKLAVPPEKDTLNMPKAQLKTVYPQGQGYNDCIIVQPPPSAQASTSLPSATHMQLKSIQYEDIEKELAVILEAVTGHTIHVVDPKNVVTSQKEKLGPFYKRPLPYYRTAKDVSLVMLGLELDKQAKASDGKTLRSIVEGDIGAFSSHCIVAMVAPSGAGKTATIIDLATKHFVVYCVCSTPHTPVSSDFKDPNFVRLATDIEKMYMTIVQEEQGNQINIDFRVKACARERIELEFLARLLFLQFLLDRNPDLKPQQFFREQTNGGASAIGTLVFKLQEYKNITIQAMLRKIETKLRSLLAPRELGLVIAVDEAQIAENGILAGRLISPSALANSREALFGSKNEIQPQFRRGFLTPLSATLSSIQATLVVLGTALTLQNADHVCSAIAKETNFIRITEFPHFNEEDVDKLISNLVDTSDCVIPPAKRRKLSGRARFPIGIVYRLANTGSRQDNKQAILDEAVTNTIDDVMAGLKEGVRTALISDKTGQSAHLLSRMVLAYRLHGSKISFSSQKEFDFVDRGLCRLQLHSDEIHYIMDEPLALEAVEEVLKASGEDPELKEYLDQLYQIVDNLGVASTSKGNALEPLVRRSLKRFNGFRLADLPFLQGITLPEWCNKLEVRIDEIHTANGFGYTDDMAGDLAFLTKRPANKMLVAGFGTRPDGAWFFSDNHYAGTLAIKFFSGPIPQRHHKANETSSDLRCCFLQKDGLKINKSLQNIRQHFEKSDTYSKLKGILRIHVEIPSVASVEPVTYVKRHPTTGVEDVMVYIYLSNMDTFFYEGITDMKDEMKKLKELINFVSKPRKPSDA